MSSVSLSISSVHLLAKVTTIGLASLAETHIGRDSLSRISMRTTSVDARPPPAAPATTSRDSFLGDVSEACDVDADDDIVAAVDIVVVGAAVIRSTDAIGPVVVVAVDGAVITGVVGVLWSILTRLRRRGFVFSVFVRVC